MYTALLKSLVLLAGHATHLRLDTPMQQVQGNNALQVLEESGPATNAQLPDTQTDHGSPTAGRPFSFNPVTADLHDSPQLHVESLQLGPQLGPQPGQSPQPDFGLTHDREQSSQQPTFEQLQHQQQQQQQQAQSVDNVHQHAEPQRAQQGLTSEAYPTLSGPARAALYSHGQQHPYQAFSQALQHETYPSGTFPQAQQAQHAQQAEQAQQAQHAQAAQVAAAAPMQMPQAGLYPHVQLQQHSGAASEGQYGSPNLPRTVITSGAMGQHVWSRPNSRASSATSKKSQVHRCDLACSKRQFCTRQGAQVGLDAFIECNTWLACDRSFGNICRSCTCCLSHSTGTRLVPEVTLH